MYASISQVTEAGTGVLTLRGPISGAREPDTSGGTLRRAVSQAREEGPGAGVPTLNDGTITGVRDNIVTGILAVTPHPETGDSRRSDGISGHIQGHSSRGIVSEGHFRERGAFHSIRGRNAIQCRPTANNHDIWGTVFQSYKRSQSATTGVTTLTAFRCGHAQSRTSSVAGDSSGDCEC